MITSDLLLEVEDKIFKCSNVIPQTMSCSLSEFTIAVDYFEENFASLAGSVKRTKWKRRVFRFRFDFPRLGKSPAFVFAAAGEKLGAFPDTGEYIKNCLRSKNNDHNFGLLFPTSSFSPERHGSYPYLLRKPHPPIYSPHTRNHPEYTRVANRFSSVFIFQSGISLVTLVPFIATPLLSNFLPLLLHNIHPRFYSDSFRRPFVQHSASLSLPSHAVKNGFIIFVFFAWRERDTNAGSVA